MAILEHLTALSDPVRCRVLLLLERHELTVTDLGAVLQMPQSSVSRHLKTLSDDGWVVSRRDGTSRFYSMASEHLDPSAGRLWPLIREEVTHTGAAGQDRRRLDAVLARRRAKSERFFASAAGDWDRLRTELFGAGVHAGALLGLLDPALVVGDLGCGTGEVSEALAPHVARVVAVDGSGEMLEAARERLGATDNAEVRQGDLANLPLRDGELDAAVLSLVLHHAPAPGDVLAEAARVIRPGGRVLVVDMLPHERQEYRQQMGHVWLGFSESQMQRLLGAAGFDRVRIRPLPVDPAARGPALCAATGIRQDVR